jgi:hypothetical protein
MLHIWTFIAAGEKPFFVNEKEQLTLRFRPVLPGWLFTKGKRTCYYYDNDGSFQPVVIPTNAFAFKFIGRTLVVYHNPERKDTFGEGAVKAISYQLVYRDGKEKAVWDPACYGRAGRTRTAH